MDETAQRSKLGRGYWLHEELSKVARTVVGLDNSPTVPPAGLTTFANARIERGNVMDVGALLDAAAIRPDAIVAGELIEHLENPLEFLRSLKADNRLTGKTLILSTPNATAIHNCLIALLGRESTHHDHLSIFSYKTLWTLLSRADFSDWTIVPYYAAFSEMKLRHKGPLAAIIKFAERSVNLFEWCFPLMSFGYVVIVKI